MDIVKLKNFNSMAWIKNCQQILFTLIDKFYLQRSKERIFTFNLLV